MTGDQKQSELDRYRAIILAALEYKYVKERDLLILDHMDYALKHYEQEKKKIEKYYQQGKLNKLQQSLTELTTILKFQVDINFSAYVKEKTGYDIDLFEGLFERVEAIIARNKICNEEEGQEISIMLSYRYQTSVDQQIDENLLNLLNTYANTLKKSKSNYSEIIGEIEIDGVMETVERIRIGSKPDFREVEEIIAPDGKRTLRLTRFSSDGQASTGVDIQFDTANGSIAGTVYNLEGLHDNVKVFWKDNETIIIETKSTHVANIKRTQIRSFADEIRIEYLES